MVKAKRKTVARKRSTSGGMKNDIPTVNLQGCVDEETVKGLEQGYVICSSEKRFHLLLTFLRKNCKKKVIVFYSSCLSVQFHGEIFNQFGLTVTCIHVKQQQERRTKIFDDFCTAESGILLCTDVDVRDREIPAVDWLLQFDPPEDTKEYIGRVSCATRKEGGRTRALIFLRPEELSFLTYFKSATLSEYDFSWSKIGNIQPQLENFVAKYFYLNVSAKHAYRGYVRAYGSHQLKQVFDVTTLDLRKVAQSLGFAVPPRVDLNKFPTKNCRKEELISKHKTDKSKKQKKSKSGISR